MDAHFASEAPASPPVARLDPALETPPGTAAERRLHGRAHAYWRSLQGNLRVPLIEDLDLAGVPRLAESSLLFAVDAGEKALEVNLVGASVRSAWREPESAMARLIAQVKLRLPVLAAHRKPMGFEAELAGDPAGDVAYRGILLPFGRNGGSVDYVLMVVNWKERADAGNDSALLAAGIYATEKTPRTFGASPWDSAARESLPALPASAEQKVASARMWAELAATEMGDTITPTNKAIAGAYACLLTSDTLSPLAIVDTVFGRTLSRRTRCNRAAALRYARRLCLSAELLHDLLDDLGGASEVAAMEWRVRRHRPVTVAHARDHFLLTEPVRPQDRGFSPWRGRDAEPVAVEHILPIAANAKD